MRNTIRWSLFTLLITTSTVFGQYAFPNRTPLPQGQDIVARDGDRVIIEDDARVRVVRRRQGMVRTVFNLSQRWLIVLIDYAKPGEAPDGGVDMAYTYHGVDGEWPLGERWEGLIALEEYLPGSSPSSVRVGLVTPHGLVELKTFSPPVQEPSDPSAIAVLSFRGGGGGIQRGLSFDQAEQQQVAQAIRNAEMQANTAQSGSVAGGMMWSTMGGAVTGGIQGGPSGAIRVGGNVGALVKIHDVPPVYPEAARQAGIQGVVILEATIGEDGSVTNARVLRSIPLLDTPALEAVRQWRYQPMVINGKAVPVIITVTVVFPPPPTR